MTLHALMIVTDVPPQELLSTLPPGRTYVANLDPESPPTWPGQLVKLLWAFGSYEPPAVRSVVPQPPDAEAES